MITLREANEKKLLHDSLLLFNMISRNTHIGWISDNEIFVNYYHCGKFCSVIYSMNKQARIVKLAINCSLRKKED